MKEKSLSDVAKQEELTESEAMRVLDEWVSWIQRRQEGETNHINRFAHDLGVSAKALRRKIEQHEAVGEILELVDELAETELVERGLEGQYNSQVWSKVMAKQHGWHDKQELDISADMNELKEIMRKKDELVP